MSAPPPAQPDDLPPPGPTGLEDYLGERIVIDTRSSYIIIGTLRRIDRRYLTLDDVDVHDHGVSSTTKDQYIMQASKLGVYTNRRGAKVRVAAIISISRLDDVERF